MTHRLIPDRAYASHEAYQTAMGDNAVAKAKALGPDAVLAEVQQSGLRGRGGAGFPTGTKWSTLKNHSCPTRFVVCNAAEGEPGTFKDRYLLRKNPYATLEGMVIAAQVIGASRLFIALKASFKPEIKRVREAIDELRRAGIIGGREINVVEGPEEYLFGEEKALLNVIEGLGPLPREPHYPPYEWGLFAQPDSPNPALVNNVETFAHVSGIIRHGAASFRARGTADTPGTVIFTLSGDVQRPGMFERDAGISLRELLHEVAGGPRPGRSFKAILPGVSAGVITSDKLDTPCDFGSLHKIGSGLGSAGFMVFDDSRSMVRLAQMVARFLYVESCDQCTACKHGLGEASTALDRFFGAEPWGQDAFDQALAGAQSAPQGNRCYLPVQGAVLLTSLMTRFRAEFLAAAPAAAAESEPIPIPKIADFDERSGKFIYDPLQMQKQPDWTYAAAPAS